MKNETALIIGGSKGIAFDVAKKLAARGINLILVARNQDALAQAKVNIKTNSDVMIETISLDLYDRDAINQFIVAIKEEPRHLKYLLNAAGYFNPISFLEHSLDDYKAYMDINEAFFFITQAIAKNMKHYGSGSIVNIDVAMSTSPK